MTKWDGGETRGEAASFFLVTLPRSGHDPTGERGPPHHQQKLFGAHAVTQTCALNVTVTPTRQE